MKHNLFSALSVGILLICLSCDDQSKLSRIEPEENKLLNFEGFEKLGDAHNQFLSHFKDGFNVDPNISTLPDGVDHITNSHLEKLSTIQLSSVEKEILKTSIIENKHLTIFNYAFDVFYGKKISPQFDFLTDLYGQQPTVFESLDKALDKGAIDDFEHASLTSLVKISELCYDGSVQAFELKEFVIDLKEQWIKKSYKQNDKTGRVLGYVLAISLASLDWWDQNPEAGLKHGHIAFGKTEALPMWAAADIVGAVVGCTWTALGQHIFNDGDINWKQVAWAGVGAAVTASTGCIGAAGKFVSKLF